MLSTSIEIHRWKKRNQEKVVRAILTRSTTTTLRDETVEQTSRDKTGSCGDKVVEERSTTLSYVIKFEFLN